MLALKLSAINWRMKKHIPLIFTIFAFIILVAMGTWQLQRLQWKTALIEKINTRLNQPPTDISSVIKGNLDDYEYRLVTVKGIYDHSKTIEIIGRPYNGKPGIHILTPMAVLIPSLTDSLTTDIIVNRGWVKYEEPYEKPADVVEATGIVRKSQQRNYLSRHITMDNVPDKNLWFYVDLPAIYQSLGKKPQTFYVELVGDIKPGSYPYALEKKINIYNEHLSYVITWYSLAVALLLVYYFRFHRKRR